MPQENSKKAEEFSLEHNLALNFHQNCDKHSLRYFITASETSQARADFIGRKACGADKSQFQPCEPRWRRLPRAVHRLPGTTQILTKRKWKRNMRILYTKVNVVFQIKPRSVEQSQGLLQAKVFCSSFTQGFFSH